jgi:hypothetical protein
MAVGYYEYGTFPHQEICFSNHAAIIIDGIIINKTPTRDKPIDAIKNMELINHTTIIILYNLGAATKTPMTTKKNIVLPNEKGPPPMPLS